jgi:hypothetical protein
MSDEELRERFRHTALWRSKADGLRRNAEIALANARLDAGRGARGSGGEDSG